MKKEAKEVATIVKRPRKNGMAFLFQTKVTDPLTGEKHVKTVTWETPEGIHGKASGA